MVSNLDENEITDISFLQDLKLLNTLKLRYNQIEEISSLKDLIHLNYLFLRGNPIHYIPKEIYDKQEN